MTKFMLQDLINKQQTVNAHSDALQFPEGKKQRKLKLSLLIKNKKT